MVTPGWGTAVFNFLPSIDLSVRANDRAPTRATQSYILCILSWQNNGALSLLIIDHGLWNRFHVERARGHAATEVAVADAMTQASFRTKVDVRVKGSRHPNCFVIASKIRKEADQATTTYSRHLSADEPAVSASTQPKRIPAAVTRQSPLKRSVVVRATRGARRTLARFKRTGLLV